MGPQKKSASKFRSPVPHSLQKELRIPRIYRSHNRMRKTNRRLQEMWKRIYEQWYSPKSRGALKSKTEIYMYAMHESPRNENKNSSQSQKNMPKFGNRKRSKKPKNTRIYGKRITRRL